jgi:drug/metabolite transporter (DMT)-like permease
MNKTYGITLILIASLLFGSYGVWAKLIGGDMGAFFQGWSRGLVIAVAGVDPIHQTRNKGILVGP